MPQVAERRNGYGPNRVDKAVDRAAGPKNGSAKSSYPRQYPRNADRAASPSKPANADRAASPSKPANGQAASKADKPEAEILFQKYFKSVGPRTYAAQLKRAQNGNHFLVLTEGKRDEKTGDVRKTKLFVWSEDFVAFFRMLHEMAKHIRENPVPDEIRQKRERYWAKQRAEKPAEASTTAAKPKIDKR